MNQPMRLFKQREIWYVGFSRGKKKSLKTKDEKLATSIFREMQKEYLRGRLIQLENYKKISLKDFAEEYEKEGREGISKWSVKKDKLALKLLGDVIGEATQLRAIVDKKIVDFQRTCRARGVKEITINGYLRHIKAAFSWAVEKGYLTKRPAIKMYKMKTTQEQDAYERILEPSEIRAILKTAKGTDIDLWRLFMVLLWTGGRRREALNLEWQRVNFKQDTLILDGKTGRRTIPMLKPVKSVLKPVKKDIGRVFPEWHPDTVSKKFKAIARAANVPDHRLHDLRHTAATYMIMKGVPLDVVQKILGHANIATTQIYARVREELMKREMQKLRFE